MRLQVGFLKAMMIASFAGGMLQGATITSGYFSDSYDIYGESRGGSFTLSDGITGGASYQNTFAGPRGCNTFFTLQCTLSGLPEAYIFPEGGVSATFSADLTLSPITFYPVLDQKDHIYYAPFTAEGSVFGPSTLFPPEPPCPFLSTNGCHEPVSGYGIASFTVTYHPAYTSLFNADYYTLTDSTYTFTPEPATFMLLIFPVAALLLRRRPSTVI